MTEVIIFLVILGVAYYAYYELIYKKTKSYKEKQISKLIQETDNLISGFNLQEKLQALFEGIISKDEEKRYIEEFQDKSEKEKDALLEKLLKPKDENLENKPTFQRMMLILDKFNRTKLKYARLMEKLKYDSIDERLKATIDWNDYVKIFVDESSADPNQFRHVLVTLDEIEKRFDKKLKHS